MVGPFPKDRIMDSDTRLNRGWDVWFNKVGNAIDFGSRPSTVTPVVASEGIPISSQLMRVISSTAGNVTITANPAIPFTDDGTFVRLEGNDDVRTVTLNNGNGLVLTGGAPMVLGNNDVIALHFNKTKNLWVEDYRANN